MSERKPCEGKWMWHCTACGGVQSDKAECHSGLHDISYYTATQLEADRAAGLKRLSDIAEQIENGAPGDSQANR